MLYNLYFSPTKSTRAVALAVAEALASSLGQPLTHIDWTTPTGRLEPPPVLTAADILVLAFPVYAGRIPALLESLLRDLRGQATPAVALAVYGNRDFDDALLEACDLLTEQDCVPVAAGAFIGEHSYSAQVGAGRPTPDDLAAAEAFARQAAAKLRAGNRAMPTVPGARPYKKREPAPDMRPQTTDACNGCGICVSRCPVGIIDAEAPAHIAAGCLRCCACVKACPCGAKYFEDPRMLAFRTFLETNCLAPKAPATFI